MQVGASGVAIDDNLLPIIQRVLAKVSFWGIDFGTHKVIAPTTHLHSREKLRLKLFHIVS